jgi:hypothetical protein
MKFYPPAKNTNDTSLPNHGNNVGVVICTDGNLFANYEIVFGLGFRGTNTGKQYFCTENSESTMFTVNYRTISSNDVLITCTITIPFDSYIGGQTLGTFQYWCKILNSQKHCDFVIKVQNKSFNVHKCVLSTHWPYFITLLESEMSEANSGTLTIEDQNPDVIEAMIYYIYTGTSNVTDVDLALELITVSDKYNLSDLEVKSLQFVIAKMNKYCVIKGLLKAKLHGLDDLFEACIDFLKNDTNEINDLSNYDLLAKSEDGFEFLALCFDNIRGIKRKLEESDDESGDE